MKLPHIFHDWRLIDFKATEVPMYDDSGSYQKVAVTGYECNICQRRKLKWVSLLCDGVTAEFIPEFMQWAINFMNPYRPPTKPLDEGK